MSSLPKEHNIATKLVSLTDYERQRSLVDAIIEASPEGILVVNEHNIIVSHNRAFVEIWRIPDYKLKGYESDSAVGADDNPILAHNAGCVKDKEAFLARIRELYSNPHLDDHCEFELKDGRMLERHSTVLRNSEGQYLGRVWFFRDITTIKQTEAKLKDLASRDPLTGVANRRYFFEHANQEYSRSKRLSTPLSIAVLDVDYFKQINDQYGHAMGDAVLKSLCNVIQSMLRDIDIFARIGGEEFALLLPHTNLEGAVLLTKRLQQTISDGNHALMGSEIKFTISVGVATLKTADTCIEECMIRADTAMYKAKKNGRNRVEVDF